MERNESVEAIDKAREKFCSSAEKRQRHQGALQVFGVGRRWFADGPDRIACRLLDPGASGQHDLSFRVQQNGR